MDTIKVKPWGKDQGDFVLINAEDFDAEKHEKIEHDEHKRRARKTEQAAKE